MLTEKDIEYVDEMSACEILKLILAAAATEESTGEPVNLVK